MINSQLTKTELRALVLVITLVSLKTMNDVDVRCNYFAFRTIKPWNLLPAATLKFNGLASFNRTFNSICHFCTSDFNYSYLELNYL